MILFILSRQVSLSNDHSKIVYVVVKQV